MKAEELIRGVVNRFLLRSGIIIHEKIGYPKFMSGDKNTRRAEHGVTAKKANTPASRWERGRFPLRSEKNRRLNTKWEHFA